MNNVPIRLRLTLTFGTAVGVLLALGGFLLYHHLATSLDRTLDNGLRARAANLAALVKQDDPGLREAPSAPVADAAGSFAQVVDRRGRIHDETRGLGAKPLLPAGLLPSADTGPLIITRVHRLGTDVRLLVSPLGSGSEQLVLIVGAPLNSRDRTLASLRNELLVGGPIALLLASLIGFVVAAAALRPVEKMRARAASISGPRLRERLPVPRTGDEIARLGSTLNELLARLERSVERERSFVADASHELRSPLALIRAEVELALDAPRDTKELEAALRSIGEEADKLTALADDLLLLARYDEGSLPLRIESVDVPAMLESVAARFERRAVAVGRRIESGSPFVRVQADRLRLEQAVVNLVENALRYGSGTIRLSAAERADRVEIHVRDEGAGFPEQIADTAFERFTRADAARGEPGAGLGLAIARAILETHGGTVSLAARSTGADVVLAVPRGSAAQLTTTRS